MEITKMQTKGWSILWRARLYLAEEYFLGPNAGWRSAAHRDAFALICKLMQGESIDENCPAKEKTEATAQEA